MFKNRYKGKTRAEKEIEEIEEYINQSEELKRFGRMGGDELYYKEHFISNDLYDFLNRFKVIEYFDVVYKVSYELRLDIGEITERGGNIRVNARVKFIDEQFEQANFTNTFINTLRSRKTKLWGRR